MTWNYQKYFGKCKTGHYCNPNNDCSLLCLNEKYEITTCKGDNLLRKRTQIIDTCSKYKLAYIEKTD